MRSPWWFRLARWCGFMCCAVDYYSVVGNGREYFVIFRPPLSVRIRLFVDTPMSIGNESVVIKPVVYVARKRVEMLWCDVFFEKGPVDVIDGDVLDITYSIKFKDEGYDDSSQ